MGKSLGETVTHRDAQESVHSFQLAIPKMKRSGLQIGKEKTHARAHTHAHTFVSCRLF